MQNVSTDGYGLKELVLLTAKMSQAIYKESFTLTISMTTFQNFE